LLLLLLLVLFLLLLLLTELHDTAFTLAVVDTDETGLDDVTETVNIDDTIVEGATVVTVTDTVEFVVVGVTDVVLIVTDSWDCSEAVEIADTEVAVEADEEFEAMALGGVVELVVVLVEPDADVVVVVVVTGVLEEVAVALLLTFEALL
jgi:hypothetical protein